MTAVAHAELLVVPNCPNEHHAAAAFRRALTSAGFDRPTLTTVVISTPEQARERAFTGSPSFYINGHDILPTTAPPALACRMYRSESETLAGIPDGETLASAIQRAL